MSLMGRTPMRGDTVYVDFGDIGDGVDAVVATVLAADRDSAMLDTGQIIYYDCVPFIELVDGIIDELLEGN